MSHSRKLQQAAKAFGDDAGALIARVELYDASGQIVARLPVHPGQDAAEPEIADDAQALPGWDFSGSTPRFDGAKVEIHGQIRLLLQTLAEAKEPLKLIDLKRKAWTDYTPEDASVRWSLMELRKQLRLAFPGLEDDPIANSPLGYSLVIR